MFQEISRAEKSIYLEMYIFLDDTDKGHDFVGLLKAKASAGVEVVIIADAFGSLAIKKQTVFDLRQAGVEFLFFSHFWRRTHRKIVIVDKRVAFLGGVNIEKKISHWQDLQIKFQGKNTVRAVLRSFSRSYQMAGGKNQELLNYYRKSAIKKIKSLVLENMPGKSRRYFAAYYREKLLGAKTSIKIVTPYLLPPRWLLALMDDACRRGVEIKIIIPGDTDVKIFNQINYSYAAKILPLGVKVFTSPKMNHAKIMIVDDEEGLIGSQNLDLLSFNWNFEIGVFSRQREMVSDLKNIFFRWEKRALPFQNKKIKINVFHKIIIRLIRLFLSIM